MEMATSAKSLKSRGSSVVERIIGNDEVGSSILPRGTSFSSIPNLKALWPYLFRFSPAISASTA